MRRITAWILSIALLAPATLSWAASASLELSSQADLSKSRRWLALGNGGWVSVAGGQLDFLSPAGKRQRRLNLRGNEYLFGEFGSRFVGVIAFADRQPQTLSAVTFDLFDVDGTQVVRLNKPSFASAIVSPEGNAFVGVDGAEGLPKTTLRFYTADGKLHETIDVARFEGGEFTRDGSHVFFKSADSGLQVCTMKGEQLGTFGPADRWAASRDGSVVVIARGQRLMFYHDGKLIQTLTWGTSDRPIRALALSPNGLHAAAISNDHAAVIDVSSATVLWETDTGDPQWNLRSVDLINDARLVALGLDYDPGPLAEGRHNQSRCLLFDRTGQLLDTQNETPSKWGAVFPMVKFTGNGTSLLFINRDKFRTFQVNLGP